MVVYLGLGSNLGDRFASLQQAIRGLSDIVNIDAVSPVYETDPVGYRDQPPFLNAVVRGRTSLSPHRLLKLLKQIELSAGRQPSFRNAPRPLDIDILIYEDFDLNDRDLTIPHPRIAERAFVLVPLADLAPNETLPSGLTVTETLRQVDRRGVRPFSLGLSLAI